MNIKSWLVAKLLANTALVTAIGGQSHLLPQHPGTIAVFPCLIYTEANHATTGYYDNVATAIESLIVFDIYTSGGTTSMIFDALQTVMAGLFYNLDFSSDVPEADLSLRHKTCRYRRTVRAEDLT
jgi:hypothetical protein